MNIPPKYEYIVAQLEAALGREADLREEIEMAKQVQEATDAIVTMVDGQRDRWIEKCGLLKQRLTVAEQRLSQVEGACDLAMSAIDDDERGANFVKIIQAIKDKAELKTAETLFEKGQRLFRESHGSSSLWGECSNDAELPEVHRGWMAARLNGVKP